MIIRKPIFLKHVNHVYSHIIHDNLHKNPWWLPIWFSYPGHCFAPRLGLHQLDGGDGELGEKRWDEPGGEPQISEVHQIFFWWFPWGFFSGDFFLVIFQWFSGDWDSMGIFHGMYFTKLVKFTGGHSVNSMVLMSQQFTNLGRITPRWSPRIRWWIILIAIVLILFWLLFFLVGGLEHGFYMNLWLSIFW